MAPASRPAAGADEKTVSVGQNNPSHKVKQMDIPHTLVEAFTCTSKSNWVRLDLKDGYTPAGFTSNRIGKWLPRGDVAFTIGSSEAGRAIHLDDTIRKIIRDARIEPEDQPSTSGNGAMYPAFNISKTDDATARAIFAAVTAAVYAVGE